MKPQWWFSLYNGGSNAERRGSSLEARDGGSGHTSEQAGQESAAAAGTMLAIVPEPTCWTVFTHPCLQDWRLGAAPGGTNPKGPPLPPNQATAPAGIRPQGTRARELRRGSLRHSAAQHSGNCSSHPQRRSHTRAPSNPEEPRAQMARSSRTQSLLGKRVPALRDIVGERRMGLHFPRCLEVGRTRK